MSETLEELKSFIGRNETADDVAVASQIGRLAATLDVDHPVPAKGDAIPSMWHGAFFPPLAPMSALRGDGQPGGRGITPPVPLPRRSLMGVRAEFPDPIRIGDELVKISEVADVVVDAAGPTVLVTMRETISTARGPAVIEERDLLYFGADGPGARAAPPSVPEAAAWRRDFESDPVMMFRASAVRFNSHRVHYDRDYTTKVEGMPGLVVPLTLTSALMAEMCRAEMPDRVITAFAYKSAKRIFDTGPFAIFGAPGNDGATLWARDHEDALCVTAEARFGG